MKSQSNIGYTPDSQFVSDYLVGKKLHSGVEVLKVPLSEWRKVSDSVGTYGWAARDDMVDSPIQRFIVITDDPDGTIISHEIGHSVKKHEPRVNISKRRYLLEEFEADLWSFEKTGNPINAKWIHGLAKAITKRYGGKLDDNLKEIVNLYNEGGVEIDWSDVNMREIETSLV